MYRVSQKTLLSKIGTHILKKRFLGHLVYVELFHHKSEVKIIIAIANLQVIMCKYIHTPEYFQCQILVLQVTGRGQRDDQVFKISIYFIRKGVMACHGQVK